MNNEVIDMSPDLDFKVNESVISKQKNIQISESLVKQNVQFNNFI